MPSRSSTWPGQPRQVQRTIAVFFFAVATNLVTAESSRAALTNFSVSGGVSAVDSTTPASPIIYAGIGSCTSTSTCDDCTGTTTGDATIIAQIGSLSACNAASVGTASQVTFTFTSSVAGTVKATKADGTTLIGTSGSTVTAGGSGSLTLTWNDICGGMNTAGNVGCQDDLTGSIKVGVDTGSDGLASETDTITVSVKVQEHTTTVPVPTPTPSTTCSTTPGICFFDLVPGDAKAFVDSTSSHSGFPNTNAANIQFKKVRFFYAKGDCDDVGSTFTNTMSTFLDVKITGTTAESFIDAESLSGLENDAKYCFRVGLIDEAGNLNNFTAMTDEVTPQEVFGLLDENKCFIATAAWGSPMDSHVEDFRQFRNKFLLNNKLGKWFVKTYYKHSPKYARKIAANDQMRTVVRTALWPIWALAWISLHLPPALIGFFFLILAILIPILTLPRRTKILGMLLVCSLSAHAQDSDVQDTDDSSAVPEATPVPEAPYPGAPEIPGQPAEETKTAQKEDGEPKKYKRPNPRPKPIRMTDAGTFYPRYTSPQTKAASLRLGSYGVPSLHNEINGVDRYFADIYQSSGVMLLFDWEWQFLRGFGKLALKVGSGFYTANGKGRFKDGTEARETYNFFLFPNTVTALYRLQFKDKQLIVPHLDAGAGYFTFAEIRSDGQKPKFGASPVGTGAAGLSILLDKIDPTTMAELDVEHGINHLYLTAELRAFSGLNKDFDFTSTMINAGFTFEF